MAPISTLSGYKDSLNNQQQQSLEELKEKLNSSIWKADLENQADLDSFLLRFLRATCSDKKDARTFRGDHAFDRVTKHLEFRKKHSLDSYFSTGECGLPKIVKQPALWSAYLAVKPNYFWKDDRAKAVVMIERFGMFASTVETTDFETDEWEALSGHLLDRVSEKMLETAKAFSISDSRGYIAICDAKGLGISMLTRVKFVSFINDIAANHYPETIRSIHIVNAPWMFGTAYSAIKPLLDPDTLEKMQIHNGVPENFCEIFDPEKLPKEFGGQHEYQLPHPLRRKK